MQGTYNIARAQISGSGSMRFGKKLGVDLV
jgi:hypothetical protein